MKPCRVSAPLTDEDLKIWRLICCWGFHLPASQHDRRVCAEKEARDADSRDAELMLAWMQGWPIDLGGVDELGECLFW